MFEFLRQKRETPKIDPGPSPVPWLSELVWRRWNANNPLGASLKTPGHPISDAWPTPVTDDDRRRAPRGPIPPSAPVPPVGTVEEHARLLESTPGEGYIGCIHWAVCCDRLTTLIGPTIGMEIPELEAIVGPLDLGIIEADNLVAFASRDPDEIDRAIRNSPWISELQKMRTGKLGCDGINFLQCYSCGRVYVVSSEP